MSFVHSLFLAALPLVGIPVAIHMLNRRRRTVIRWGAMRFLEEAQTRRRKWMRLDDLLLMLLRLIVLLLLILALAQPMFRIPWFAGTARLEVVVVVDTSMSTAVKSDTEQILDTLIEEAVSLVSQLKDGDSARVLVAGNRIHWKTDGITAIDDNSKAQLADALRSLSPSRGATDIPAALGSALAGEPTEGASRRHVVFFSDGFENGWRIDAPETWRSLQQTADSTKTHVTVVTPKLPSRISNVFVEDVSIGHLQTATDHPLQIEATLMNTGTETVEARSAQWLLNGEVFGSASFPMLNPGQRTRVELSHSFDVPGVYAFSLKLDGQDDLVLDDDAHGCINVMDHVPILLAIEPHDRDDVWASDFIRGAIQPGYDRAVPYKSIFDVTTISPREVPLQDLNDYACVVLLIGETVDGESVKPLMEYVRGGGGLWLILGPVTSVDRFNGNFYAGGAGLSAIPLKDGVIEIDPETDAAAPVLTRREHPATAVLRTAAGLDLSRVQLKRFHALDADANPDNMRLLMQGPHGSPIVFESTFGEGHVIVQAIPLELDWSSFPISRAFVVLANEWILHLSESSTPRYDFRQGDTVVVKLPLKNDTTEVMVTRPDGSVHAADVRFAGGGAAYWTERNPDPGLYHFAVPNKGNARVPIFASVGRVNNESFLDPLDGDERDSLQNLGGLRFSQSADLKRVQVKAGKPPPVAVCWTLLVLLFVALVLESLLAAVLNHRRSDRSGTISLESGVGA